MCGQCVSEAGELDDHHALHQPRLVRGSGHPADQKPATAGLHGRRCKLGITLKGCLIVNLAVGNNLIGFVHRASLRA